MEKITTLTIVLRKDIADEAAGEAAYNLVKAKLADFPEVRITGKINTQLIETE